MVGAAVTVSPWPTLRAPGPAARRGESESRSGGRRSRHGPAARRGRTVTAELTRRAAGPRGPVAPGQARGGAPVGHAVCISDASPPRMGGAGRDRAVSQEWQGVSGRPGSVRRRRGEGEQVAAPAAPAAKSLESAGYPQPGSPRAAKHSQRVCIHAAAADSGVPFLTGHISCRPGVGSGPVYLAELKVQTWLQQPPTVAFSGRCLEDTNSCIFRPVRLTI